jgi:DNA replication initiation complex subunit (GINS family)
MDLEELNYKTLRKIQQIENKSPSLSKLDAEFFTNFFKYIKKLELRLKNEKSDQRKIIIKNEIINTKKIIKNIYEQREKKILFAIMTKVRGGEPNIKNLVKSEKKMFDSILEIVVKQRQQIVVTNKITNSSVNKKIKNIDKPEKNLINNKNKIFLVKENIPEFIGIDSVKYNLRKNDIITIPKNTSELLLKREVIKEIKINK